MTYKWLVIGTLVFGFFLACQTTKISSKEEINITNINTQGLDTTGFALAEHNYKTYCAGCHGEKMNAFVDRQWKNGNKPEDLVKTIKYGIVDAGMPAYEVTFTETQLNQLVSYIQTGIANVDRYNFGPEKMTSNISVSQEYTIRVDTVVYGIEVPWGISVMEDGSMLYTERNGTLTLLDKNKKATKIEGVPKVRNKGQGGLLDIELHPNFKTNKMVYLSYSKAKTIDGKELGTTAVVRAKLVDNKLTNVEEIWEALPYVAAYHHYGSRLEFDKNGLLFIAIGDRGDHDHHPQFKENYPGKIHRIKDDGSIPSDNPFVNTPGAIPSIYSLGNRNCQGFAINPKDNVLWESEHGPRGGDEVNIILPGHNYGWPVVSYGINYNGTTFTDKTKMEGMDEPILYWVPSIAPSGMTFVKGDKYPAWKGDVMVGSLRFNYLNRCIVEGNKIVGEEILLKNIGRMREVVMGQDGFLYVGVENPGAIYRLVPTGKGSKK